jgi:hypothetical protein
LRAVCPECEGEEGRVPAVLDGKLLYQEEGTENNPSRFLKIPESDPNSIQYYQSIFTVSAPFILSDPYNCANLRNKFLFYAVLFGSKILKTARYPNPLFICSPECLDFQLFSLGILIKVYKDVRDREGHPHRSRS